MSGVREPEVAIVGGGPAGLTAAQRLREAGVAEVVVIEREAAAGGIPRHADHQGYGLRDLHRVMSGPSYAATLTERAREAGAEIWTETQVTGWSESGELELTSPMGCSRLRSRAVVLATGCRERPRPARWVAGSRPAGVLTTSTLQQRVYLNDEAVTGRALVVGAEHVAFSALQTLRHSGAEPIAMVTESESHDSYALFRLGAELALRVPLLCLTRVERIIGREQVEAVELLDLPSGNRTRIPCDLVVFTGDWIPDHELACQAGVELDPRTRGPLVDTRMRTSRPGVFAAGNLLHGAETADVAALSGGRAAVGVLAYLRGGEWSAAEEALLHCEAPLSWIVPGKVAVGDLAASEIPRRPFLLRAERNLTMARIEVLQGERVLGRKTVPQIGPARSARLGTSWLAGVETDGGPLRVRLSSARPQFGRRVHALRNRGR